MGWPAAGRPAGKMAGHARWQEARSGDVHGAATGRRWGPSCLSTGSPALEDGPYPILLGGVTINPMMDEHFDVLIVGAGLFGHFWRRLPLCGDVVPTGPSSFSRDATASAAPGTCFAIPASARIRTCIRWDIRSGHGRKQRPSRTARRSCDTPQGNRPRLRDRQAYTFPASWAISAAWSSAAAVWTVEATGGDAGQTVRFYLQSSSSCAAVIPTIMRTATCRNFRAPSVLPAASFIPRRGPRTSTTPASASW